ncbi:MAG: hypothetical protein IKK17_02980 [Oscillospiraceae bacterium]|nr:hypothetical protein [Oscillospiraceae bacterium]
MKRDVNLYFKFPIDGTDAYGYAELLCGKTERDIPYAELAATFPTESLEKTLNMPAGSLVIITPEEYERRDA